MTLTMIVTFGEERQTECSCKVLSAPRCYKAKIGMQDRMRVNSLVTERDKRFGDACKAGDTIVSYFVKGTISKVILGSELPLSEPLSSMLPLSKGQVAYS